MITSERKPAVSVIISACNYGRFISEAIESVLAQTFPLNEVEIIVVDDGSTDDTSQQVKRYKDRVRYRYKTHGGQASALNLGFEMAKGEFIALLDADDFWFPQKIERNVGAFSRFDATIIGHNLVVSDLSGIDYLFFPYRGTAWIENQVPPTSGICFRRDILKIINPIPERLRIGGSDSFIIWLSKMAGSKIVFGCEPLGVYRIHRENLYIGRATRERMKRQSDTFQSLLMCLDDTELLHTRGAVCEETKPELESTKEYLRAAIDEVSIRMQRGTYNKLKRLCEVILSRSHLGTSMVKFLLVAMLSDATYSQLKRAYSYLLYRRAKVLAEA